MSAEEQGTTEDREGQEALSDQSGVGVGKLPLVWLAYAVIWALLVATSPVSGIENATYIAVAYGVPRGFAESIHLLLGLPLIAVGLWKGTRPLPFLCGLVGIILCVGTGWILYGLLMMENASSSSP